MGESIAKFEDEFSHAVEEDEISSSATDAIDRAIFDVVLALQSEGTLATMSPPPTSEEGDQDSSGPGPGSEGHGPPSHAEANGHDEG